MLAEKSRLVGARRQLSAKDVRWRGVERALVTDAAWEGSVRCYIRAVRDTANSAGCLIVNCQLRLMNIVPWYNIGGSPQKSEKHLRSGWLCDLTGGREWPLGELRIMK